MLYRCTGNERPSRSATWFSGSRISWCHVWYVCLGSFWFWLARSWAIIISNVRVGHTIPGCASMATAAMGNTVVFILFVLFLWSWTGPPVLWEISLRAFSDQAWIHLAVHTIDCPSSFFVLVRLGCSLGVRLAHSMIGVPSAFQNHEQWLRRSGVGKFLCIRCLPVELSTPPPGRRDRMLRTGATLLHSPLGLIPRCKNSVLSHTLLPTISTGAVVWAWVDTCRLGRHEDSSSGGFFLLHPPGDVRHRLHVGCNLIRYKPLGESDVSRLKTFQCPPQSEVIDYVGID